MQLLKDYEAKKNISFPIVYIDFFSKYQKKLPHGLVGTDVFNGVEDLNLWAKELLNENNVKDFLREDDFVFMMHQGYMFWYFKISGDENPMVYSYFEGDLKPKDRGKLKYFLAEYI
ncbi:hypothetical protein BTO06_15295 [Tenacibaculum sp. SZ-18]|uniref:SMI1/KNR4 family protein n=1 Tax=Tenacibaculum sp. SZ-18 TaxID=754423 RepID=UPI000C2D5C70|nr:SMI1/KNR4 family protein [Tenacibaculum sp. SZ-18]AUC16432.1 hypothetical protein BTO06_15295 [Tenacibaculum sp. SZ-18]